MASFLSSIDCYLIISCFTLLQSNSVQYTPSYIMFLSMSVTFSDTSTNCYILLGSERPGHSLSRSREHWSMFISVPSCGRAEIIGKILEVSATMQAVFQFWVKIIRINRSICLDQYNVLFWYRAMHLLVFINFSIKRAQFVGTCRVLLHQVLSNKLKQSVSESLQKSKEVVHFSLYSYFNRCHIRRNLEFYDIKFV